MASVFGPTGHPRQLENAVRDKLRQWLPTYVQRFAEVEDINLVNPKSYSTASEAVRFPEKQLPAIVVVSTGQIGGAYEDGGRNMSADFSVGVFIAVQGKDEESSRALGMSYWWPIIAALMQKRSLAPDIFVSEHRGSEWTEIPVEQRRTKGGVEHAFSVTLKNFLNVGDGPIAPIEETTDQEYPTVESTEVDVEKES